MYAITFVHFGSELSVTLPICQPWLCRGRRFGVHSIPTACLLTMERGGNIPAAFAGGGCPTKQKMCARLTPNTH